MYKSECSRAHAGHRGRMRTKLIEHGDRIFDTYELLEMLLYEVIPQKDTNPIAKQMLERFGNIDGVFRAEEALAEIGSIGEGAVDFLIAAARFSTDVLGAALKQERLLLDQHKEQGEYLREYFERTDTDIAVALLDTEKRLIAVMELPGSDFGSAGVKPESFLLRAKTHNASFALIATRHRYGALYPNPPEMVTTRMVVKLLQKEGVEVLEHFLLDKWGYKGISNDLGLDIFGNYSGDFALCQNDEPKTEEDRISEEAGE